METMLSEILEIPLRAQDIAEQQVPPLPLQVPYLGMGSSYFAPLAFKYLGLDIYPEIASEFEAYLSASYPKKMSVILSQSGKSTEALWCSKLFDQYIAISNNLNSPLCLASNVTHTIPMLAGDEHYSSSKTYTNTLIALFKGFGYDPSGSIALLVAQMDNYRRHGEYLATQVFELLRSGKVNGLFITGSGPNIATALEAALILSESTKLDFHGLPMAQYDHGPKETAANSIVIQVMAPGKSYERTRKLSKTIADAGAHVFTVECEETNEAFTILHNIVPFNFMAYYLATRLQVGETFLVGGKVTEVS